MKPDIDDKLDRMNAVYWVEYDRWQWRWNREGTRFELVRNTSPSGDLVGESYQEITTLTKRECKNKHDAEAWCKTFATRAAMGAALERLFTTRATLRAALERL